MRSDGLTEKGNEEIIAYKDAHIEGIDSEMWG